MWGDKVRNCIQIVTGQGGESHREARRLRRWVIVYGHSEEATPHTGRIPAAPRQDRYSPDALRIGLAQLDEGATTHALPVELAACGVRCVGSSDGSLTPRSSAPTLRVLTNRDYADCSPRHGQHAGVACMASGRPVQADVRWTAGNHFGRASAAKERPTVASRMPPVGGTRSSDSVPEERGVATSRALSTVRPDLLRRRPMRWVYEGRRGGAPSPDP